MCAPQEPHFDEVKETNPVVHREPIEELKKIANQNEEIPQKPTVSNRDLIQIDF